MEPQPPATVGLPLLSTDPKNNKPAKKYLFIGLVLIILFIASTAGLIYSYSKQKNQLDKLNNLKTQLNSLKSQPSKESQSIQADKFQAVFLASSSNNSTYFGKLSVLDPSTYKLTDIYYLNKDYVLVKLGNELHKPQDAMYIPKSNVTFWENLQDAGQFNNGLK